MSGRIAGSLPIKWRTVSAAAATLAMVAVLVGVALRAQAELADFNAYAIDGVFQLFNPLRRMAAGYRLGVDFQFFHGAGVPLVHYPVFRMLGGDLAASELSRQLVSAALFLASSTVMLRALGFRWAIAALLSSALAVAADVLSVSALFRPGNSLLGVRSAMPLFIVGLVSLWAERTPPTADGIATARRAVLLAACVAVAVVLGTEHGIASLAAFFVVGACTSLWRRSVKGRALQLVAVGGLLLVATAVVFASIAGTHASEPLRHALVTVPADQFWYFGAPPNAFVFEWSQLGADPLATCRWAAAAALLAVLVLLYVRSGSSENPTDSPRVAAALLALVYGIASSASWLGRISIEYTEPLWRIELLIATYLVVAWIPRALPIRLVKAARRLGHGCVAVAFAVAAVIGAKDLFSPPPTSGPPLARPGPVVLGATLGFGWTGTRDIALRTLGPELSHGSDEPIIWSTYAGLLEAELGVFHPDVDYIIHALGPGARARYAEHFRTSNPRFAATIRRSYMVYEEWLQHSHWAFYEALVTRYEPVAVTGHSILWRRTHGDPKLPSWDGTIIPAPAEDVILPSATDESDAVLVVEVEYATENALERVPFVGNLPRYLLLQSGTDERQPVSLPPYETRWTFALHRRPGVAPTLRPVALTLVGNPHLVLHRVRYRTLPISKAARDALLDRLPWGEVQSAPTPASAR